MAQIGIQRELRNLPQNMQHDSVTNYFFQPSIKRMRVCWKIQIKPIKQTFTDRIIPDEMFTTTIFQLESLRNIRPVTNISDDINHFEY